MALDLFSSMKSFATIVEHGSFYKASQHLYVSPSVLTKQIRYLEDLLGKKLLNRTTRTLSLTEAGELYIYHVKNILYQVENSKNDLLNLENEPHGLIKIGVPSIFDHNLFAKAFAEFLGAYPKISLHIVNENLPNNLTNHTLDIMISEININDTNFCKDYLCTIDRCILGSPLYIDKYKAPKNIEELKKHNCLIYTNATPTHEWIFNNKKVKVSGNYVSNSFHNICIMAKIGLGLIWVPKIVFQEEIKSGDFIEVKFRNTSSKLNMWLYSLPSNNTNIKLITNYLKNFFANVNNPLCSKEV